MAFLQLLHEPPLYIALLLLLCSCMSNCSFFPPAASLATALDCFPPDLQALRAFAPHIARASAMQVDYAATYSDSAALKELWGPGDDCCSWHGIGCNFAPSSGPGAGSYRVSSIGLFIYSFSNLSFTGNFVQPLCNLSLLSTLKLDYIFESAARPRFDTQMLACLGHLHELSDLSLTHMHFQGPLLPDSFSNLLQLKSLDMSSYTDRSLQAGSLRSGSLLPISNLSSLAYVGFIGCGLSGPLPAFQTPLLETLDLSDNFFNSTLQNFILLSNLPSLTSLDLSNNAISGSIPPSISRISKLAKLILSSNSLSGEIPASICKLSKLVEFYLDHQSNNGFGFDTPLDVLQCKFINLTDLSLAGNRLRGPFPRWIGDSPSLWRLDLSDNLFQGPLPSEWRNLQNLWDLDLSGNSLLPPPNSNDAAARLPDWLFQIPLKNLTLASCDLQTKDLLCSGKLSLLNNSLLTLDLRNNSLTGRETLECFTLHSFSRLYSLVLSENPLSIVLSDALLFQAGTSYMTYTELYLSSCNLQGIEINRPASFRFVDLSRNSLAMNLVALLASLGLSSCSSNSFLTRGIDLSDNALVGEIPSSLGLCNLTIIRLHNNSLVGPIPISLASLASLAVLTLNNNQLSGTIPAPIVELSSLILLDLSYNYLEGDLNTLFSISKTTYLRVVLLSHNRINGSIPSNFGTYMPDLQLIDFSDNRLTGIIPKKLNLSYLQNLQARDMNLSSHPLDAMGIVYDDFKLVVKGVELTYSYVLAEMTSFDLSSNFLEGEIPTEMGDLTGLLYLNLSHNHLSGQIPSSLSKLSQLAGLDLSFNGLEGPLPSQLSNITELSTFNVSYNTGLRGRVPEGLPFDNTESYIGDLHLCGSPALKDCMESTSASINTTVPNMCLHNQA